MSTQPQTGWYRIDDTDGTARFYKDGVEVSVYAYNLHRLLERRQAAWDALPWYQKVYRRTRSVFRRLTGRLGAAYRALRGDYDYDF